MGAEFGQPRRTVVISENAEAVRCAHGLRILPDDTIDKAPELDLLIVPGGRGARLHARNNPKILEFVRRKKGIVASVCTGAMVLAAAGVLDGLDAATHYSRFDMLREYDRVTVREGVRLVMHDRIGRYDGRARRPVAPTTLSRARPNTASSISNKQSPIVSKLKKQ